MNAVVERSMGHPRSVKSDSRGAIIALLNQPCERDHPPDFIGLNQATSNPKHWTLQVPPCDQRSTLVHKIN